jgi:hypothetical protein
MPMTINESLLVGMSFANQMASDETITTSNSNGTTAVSAVDAAGEVANIIETGSMSMNGQVLQARIEEADAGVYTVTFLAATSGGNVIEAALVVSVGRY